MAELEKPAARFRLWQHGAIFLFACLILISRRPDAIFHAQFYAEDGKAWYADAYNFGWWHALFLPYSGIFQTVPRICASLALLLPFATAPLLLTIFEFLFLALPVNFLLSSRSSAWGSVRFRALLAVAYLALPDSTEISYGISYVQWPMALGAALLVVAAVPQGWTARVFEAIYLLLAGLTGPPCIVILPIAAFLLWKSRDRWRWAQCSILAICTMAQLCALFILDPTGRPGCSLGASPMMLMRILCGDIFMGALVGRNGLGTRTDAGGVVFVICFALAGLAIVISCFLKSESTMRLFLLFTALLLAVSLVRPSFYPHGATEWQVLAERSDIRYWVMPSLAFLWVLLWNVQSGNAVMKFASIVLLCAACFGAAVTWIHPALKDLHFTDYARRFESAPPGTVMIIPENPKGFQMQLVKQYSR
jgi:hypothetical protein